MQSETSEALIDALRTCELFTAEQLSGMIRELAPLGDDAPALMRRILQREWMTLYQLRKVLHRKGAELLLGPYVLCEKIGEGGMGKVYRGRRVRDGLAVALKIVRPILLANPIIRKRYEREVATALTLKHPNIVAVFDAGEVDGRYYLAMEFVDGIDLSQLIKAYRSLEVAEACEYARQAALGLQHAHEAGFVHRDIKPSNVVVAGERHVPQATERCAVKILDMGLIRSVGLEDDGPTDLTRHGTVVGTPDYMAPEQAKNSSTVDHRADLYSLGCMLYFLIAGRPPFPDGNAIEKIIKHQMEAPLPLQALRPEVPTSVAEVVARLMAKSPGDRYPTALAAAHALEPLASYSHAAATPARLNVSPIPDRAATHVPLGQHVSASDSTPRPPGMSDPVRLPVGGSPFSALMEPPSSDSRPTLAPRRPRPSRRWPSYWQRRRWPLLAALVVLVAAGIGLWAAFAPPSAKPQTAPQAEPPPGEPPPKSIPKTGIVPTINLARLNSYLSLIPENAGTVVIAYPAAYLRDKESPYARGPGPAQLGTAANRLASETALALAQSDRIVFSIPSEEPAHFLLASEGDYVTAKFAADLEKHPRLRALTPTVGVRNVKLFSVPGNRQTALFAPAPPSPPVYLLSGGTGSLSRYLLPRLTGSRVAPAELAVGMQAALRAATETRPPLLFAVVGANQKLPLTGRPTLGELGIELLTLRLRIGETLDVDVAISGSDAKAVRRFPERFAQVLREEHPNIGRAITDALARGTRSEEQPSGSFRLTLKLPFTPDQWSAFLEGLLAN